MQSGGGLGYRTDTELLTALRRIIHDPDLRDELAARGYASRMGEWSEAEHLGRYFALIDQARAIGAQALVSPAARVGPAPPISTSSRSATTSTRSAPPRTTCGDTPNLAFTAVRDHEEPSTVPPRDGDPPGGSRRGAGALAAVCFARLLADPVGADRRRRAAERRPRKPGRARPVGNDLIFLFLPHHSSIAAASTSSATCRSGMPAGSAAGRWSATRRAGCSIPRSGPPGGRAAPSALGWLTIGHLSGAGSVFTSCALGRSGPMGGDGRGGGVPGVTVPAGPYL